MADFSIPGSNEQPILGSTHTPTASSEGGPDAPLKGVVLIAHGHKGYKDYGFLPSLAQALADRGYVAHRFNFSHSGMTEQTDTFARPDLFEQDTWMRQVHDLIVLHQAATVGQLPGTPAGLPITWFGHSRGGTTCLLAAAKLSREGLDIPYAVVTAAAPAECNRLSEGDQQTLLDEGRLLNPSARTGQDLFTGKAWLQEILDDPEAHDPLVGAELRNQRLTIVHGTADDTVPLEHSQRLNHAAPGSRLLLLDQQGHVFDDFNALADACEPNQTDPSL